MVDRGIVQEWIEKAEEDFEFARINLEEGKRFFAQICFHFHQAAEKISQGIHCRQRAGISKNPRTSNASKILHPIRSIF